jgi:dual specificity tyrosine-phosphorylation-regulated kinase 2/3/4
MSIFSEDMLNNYERTEVDEYEEVWYLARQDQKYIATKLERLVNNGFDDQEGYYRLKAGD